nr:hypothetical protein [Desulfobacterales bacterium]
MEGISWLVYPEIFRDVLVVGKDTSIWFAKTPSLHPYQTIHDPQLTHVLRSGETDIRLDPKGKIKYSS